MVQNKVITLAEVIRTMDSGQRFDIEVVQADIKRGTGGQLVSYANCVKSGARQEQAHKLPARLKLQSQATKSPYHYQNSTRNIYLLHKREIKTIHLRLITRFNGHIVL